MDSRAEKVLRRHGYRSDLHRAHQVTAEEIRGADLVVAMEDIHVTKMLGIAPEAQQRGPAHRLRSRRRAGIRGAGSLVRRRSGFEDTLAAVEAAMPGILDRVRELQAARTG